MDRRDVKALSDDELRERGFNEIDIGLFRSGHSSRIDIWIEGMNDPLLSSVPRAEKDEDKPPGWDPDDPGYCCNEEMESPDGEFTIEGEPPFKED